MFSVSPAEAHAMDPQQRLLLEASYEATHAALLRRGELLGRDMGVFVGLSARQRQRILQFIALIENIDDSLHWFRPNRMKW